MESAKRALAPGGNFLFDLQTRSGLAGWNDIGITDRPDLLMVERGVWDGAARQVTRMFSGCVRGKSGQFDRFQQLIQNHVYDMTDVVQMLQCAGFSEIEFVSFRTLARTTAPEDEERIMIAAR